MNKISFFISFFFLFFKMEFCSEYGLNYGFNGSETEDLSDEENNEFFKMRKADSNIICVKLNDISNPVDCIKQDEIFNCKRCGAFISNISKTRIKKSIWKCEFCYEKNDVSQKTLLSHTDSFEYVTESCKTEKTVNKNCNYLLCIDISENMNKKSLDLSSSDLESDENLNELYLRSNTSSSFISFSDNDEDDDANLSNIVDEKDIILNTKQLENEAITEEEIKLSSEIENIEHEINNINDKEQSKDQLMYDLEILKMKQLMLKEQQSFFEDSLRKQDAKRIRELQKNFSQCSTLNVRNYEETATHLNSIKAVFSDCLDRLKQLKSNASVALLTFNDKLCFYNGCTSNPLLVVNNEKDLLNSISFNEIAESMKEDTSFSSVRQIIQNLSAQGNSSLGFFCFFVEIIKF